MEQLTEFLASQNGKMLCVFLIVIGMTDFYIAKAFLGKRIKEAENAMLSMGGQQERDDAKNRIKGLNMAAKLIAISGMTFIAFGIFGLTR